MGMICESRCSKIALGMPTGILEPAETCEVDEAERASRFLLYYKQHPRSSKRRCQSCKVFRNFYESDEDATVSTADEVEVEATMYSHSGDRRFCVGRRHPEVQAFEAEETQTLEVEESQALGVEESQAFEVHEFEDRRTPSESYDASEVIASKAH